MGLWRGSWALGGTVRVSLPDCPHEVLLPGLELVAGRLFDEAEQEAVDIRLRDLRLPTPRRRTENDRWEAVFLDDLSGIVAQTIGEFTGLCCRVGLHGFLEEMAANFHC